MERILAREFGQIFVDDDTTGFQRFGRQLFVFTRTQMHAQREILNTGVLATDIKDLNLGVRYTTAVT